jgi:predicted outer membrane repeat protein
MAGNKAGQYGGGIYGGDYEYQTTVTRSTFSGNTAGNSDTAGYGGAIYAQDDVLSVQNSTFNGNRAQSVTGTPGQGGAIWFSGSRMGLTYSTVAGNYARRGAGVYAYAEGGSLLGDILSQNRTSRHGSEQDCAVGSAYSKLSSVGGNVLGQASCVTGLQPTDKVSKKPRLGKLKDNGGPTKTMAISAKSPAVGRASYLVPATDQRGHGRPGKHADAGAFELPKKH